MSVIGTTLKQPRVFAHDAVRLCELPGCTWRGSKDLKVIEPGTGFVNGDTYSTWLSTPITTSNAGNGIKVTVTALGADDGIEEVTVLMCGYGNAYNVGDLVTVNSPTAGGEPAVLEVQELLWTPWDYGCPFTSFYMGLQDIKVDDVQDARVGESLYGKVTCEDEELPPGGLPNLGDADIFASGGGQSNKVGPIQTLPAFMQKTKYVYSCECEGEEPLYCSCTFETPGPGAAIYVGYPLAKLELMMESGNKALYRNVPAGTFMPVSALTVCDALAEEGEGAPGKEELKNYILALF